MATLQETFERCLEEFLEAAGWRPIAKTGRERRQYFGSDRQREWLQPDFWAVLNEPDQALTVLAEIDSNYADLGHNVAKYLWWVSERKPFWETPAMLISAYSQRKPKDYLLHENIARFLGSLLEKAAPGTRHSFVGIRGEANSVDAGEVLAERAFEVVRAELLRASVDSPETCWSRPEPDVPA